MQAIRRYGYENVCDLQPSMAQTSAYDECPATQYFFSCIVNRSGTFCPHSYDMLEDFDKRVSKTLQQTWHSFWTIVPILFFLAFGYVTSRQMCPLDGHHTTRRFMLEFCLIIIPTVLCVNVLNYLVEYIVLAMTVGLLIIILRAKCSGTKTENVQFDLGGSRPHMLTLARATINILTALCILAIDFESFPKEFRKSRRYGAALMDTGIGLFAFAMGSVSRRLTNFRNFLHLLRYILPVLVLGIARTVVILAIEYHQDEHEYGVHLNAFFTLGLTKLFGSMLSAAASNNKHLLLLGLGMLLIHEIALQGGISEFVMSIKVTRNTFLRANREGICSLPGFIVIYILSMCIGQWLQTTKPLSLKEFRAKLMSLVCMSSVLWLSVLLSIPILGIARVTCNFGYISWILAIALTMLLLFMFVFNFVLQITCDHSSHKYMSNLSEEVMPMLTYVPNVPILVESINYNGLLYFLLANILTGQVNIFLQPETRTSIESVLILVIYMLISSIFAFLLYTFRIKIA